MFAQQTDFNQSYIADSSFYSRITYKDIKGNIMVRLKIQGEFYDFMLDTGAPLLITKKLSEKLGFETLEKIPVSDQSDKMDTMEVVLVDQFLFGGVTFKNAPALVAKDNPILECFEIDGLIGSNVLKDAVVQINKQDKEVLISNDKSLLKLPKVSSELFLDPVQSGPYFKIQLKGKKGRANEQLLFDTGMDALYDLSESHYKIFNEKVDVFEHVEEGYGNNSFGLHGAADNSQYLRGEIPKMKIGKFTIQNVAFALTKDKNSRIGNELLDYGVVTVDYLNRMFYVEPTKKKIEHVEPRFPINPTYSNGKFVVGIIWDKNLEDKMSIGDEIISINDQEYKGSTLCDLMMKNSIFKDASVNQLTITYIHDGQEETITIYNQTD